eukprot:13622146-Alexandrium_andersonii.AAC.1
MPPHQVARLRSLPLAKKLSNRFRRIWLFLPTRGPQPTWSCGLAHDSEEESTLANPPPRQVACLRR